MPSQVLKSVSPYQNTDTLITTTMYDYGDLFGLTSADFIGNSQPDSSPPIYTPPPPLTLPNCDFDSAAFVGLKFEVGYSSSSSSSYYGSPSSLPNCYSQRPNLVQRSLSSHSLHNKDSFYHPIFSSLDEFPGRPDHILKFDTGPIRKVYSSGDLEGNNMVQNSGLSESPLSNENCIIEGINKATRYTAEERKERIERYRSKRTQRNFTKKIKYACRKTLADSRPRIRGRFARNDEMVESSSQYQCNQIGIEENDDIAWQHLYQAFSIMPH